MDDYLCQICCQVKLGDSAWRPDLTGTPHGGNVCPACMKVHARTNKVGNDLRLAVEHQLHAAAKKPLLSLRDHCQAESGGLTGAALDRYISRYYGHS